MSRYVVEGMIVGKLAVEVSDRYCEMTGGIVHFVLVHTDRGCCVYL